MTWRSMVLEAPQEVEDQEAGVSEGVEEALVALEDADEVEEATEEESQYLIALE